MWIVCGFMWIFVEIHGIQLDFWMGFIWIEPTNGDLSLEFRPQEMVIC